MSDDVRRDMQARAGRNDARHYQRIDEHGGVSRTVSTPHLMFYGPDPTDSDIGGVRGAFVFMNRVGPDGMMIVPIGEKERQEIIDESHALVTRIERAIGYQPAR